MKVHSISSGQVIEVSDAHADGVLLKQGWKKYVVPVATAVAPFVAPVIIKEKQNEDETEKEDAVAVQDAIAPRKIRKRRTNKEIAAASVLMNMISNTSQGPRRRKHPVTP